MAVYPAAGDCSARGSYSFEFERILGLVIVGELDKLPITAEGSSTVTRVGNVDGLVDQQHNISGATDAVAHISRLEGSLAQFYGYAFELLLPLGALHHSIQLFKTLFKGLLVFAQFKILIIHQHVRQFSCTIFRNLNATMPIKNTKQKYLFADTME